MLFGVEPLAIMPNTFSRASSLFLTVHGGIKFFRNASFNTHGKYNFNSDWKVFVGGLEQDSMSSFDDAAWKDVTLPHDWGLKLFLKS